VRSQSNGANSSTWVSLHNQDRQFYQGQFGYSFVPLSWSEYLEKGIQSWVNNLASNFPCNQYYHKPNNEWGANLAMFEGGGSGTHGNANAVMNLWVQNEYQKCPPSQSYTHCESQGKDIGHMTQVLWRATNYVGCAQANRNGERGDQCTIYGCWYARAGNCNMRQYSNQPWTVPVMAASSPCGPFTPP
jgi:hypothetical protein